MDASDLNLEAVGDGLEFVHFSAKVGESDVDRGSQGGAQVRGAGSDVAKLGGVSECGHFLDCGAGGRESGEDGTDVGALLHGDDPELVLFVDPDEEILLSVVEDASALGPVPVKTTGFEESVSLLEEEMIVDQLLLIGGAEGVERVVLASEFSSEAVAGLHDLGSDLIPLLSGHARAERVVCQVAADSDAGRFDHRSVFGWERRSHEVSGVHVAGVASGEVIVVVVLDDGREELREGHVGLWAASVDANA